MKRIKTLLFLPILLLVAISVSSCSGPKPGTVCTTCTSGTGTVSLTMVADTLPANPSLLTFRVTITGIALVNSAGTQQALTLNSLPVVDLMRLQSDSLFLGTFANIPAGQYTGVIVSFSNPVITFLNDTAGTLQGCVSGAVCPQVALVASGTPQASLTFTVSSTTAAGIGIDLNLSNLLTISGASLTVNFATTNLLSAFTLPRTGTTLSATQFDLIEDFTGVVSISNQAITITSASATGRGSLTASATANTILNADPSGTLCNNPVGNVANCVASNQAASMDAVLNSDGTLSIQEIEPLLATLQDTVEGIVVANPNNGTQFTIIVTDLIPAAQNSLIGNLHIGDGLIVNLAANPSFFVDTKGLTNLQGSLSNFAGQSDTSAIHLGQSVAVHVTTFTAATGITLATAASSNTDTVTLRWSRFTSTPQAPSTPTFDIAGLPSYFNFAQGSLFTVQTTTGTPGTAGVTNFDGIPNTGSLNGDPVGIRALLLENTTNSANPAFFAAKVRQH
jgi:hypothetical protein